MLSQLDEDVVKILTSNGWFKERRMDISHETFQLAKDGWKIFDAAEDFLKSYIGLPEFSPPVSKYKTIEFNPLLCGMDLETVFKWQEDWGKIYPVGVDGHIFDIYIDTKGRIISTDTDYFMYVYKDLNTALRSFLMSDTTYQEKYPIPLVLD
jgi:SUKH-3 immunity protein